MFNKRTPHVIQNTANGLYYIRCWFGGFLGIGGAWMYYEAYGFSEEKGWWENKDVVTGFKSKEDACNVVGELNRVTVNDPSLDRVVYCT